MQQRIVVGVVAAAAQAVDPYTGQPLQGAPAAGAAPDAGVVQYDTQDNRRNQSSFRMHDWRPYFDNLSNGAILVDLMALAVAAFAVLQARCLGAALSGPAVA